MLKKRMRAVMSAVFLVLALTSCNKAEKGKVDISTALQIDSSFSGSRTVTLTFPKSVAALGSEQESTLDRIVQKYCPDSMNYAKNINGGKIAYSFIMKFDSAYDYTEKTTNIIGTETQVNFSNPNNVMTKGWKIEENFESAQLIKWITEGAKAENFEGLEFETEETHTTAALDDDIHSTNPMISVNNLTGYPIQKIAIETVNQKAVFDRTITFTISETTFDDVGSDLSDYFKSITDKSSSSAEWLLENKSYLYKVKFNDISLHELEGYTNHLLSSVYCEASYDDKSVGSTPLAEQNSYTETLDFSNYISNSNSNVPIEYTYSVDGSSELSECLIYQNGEWTAATNLLDTNKYGKISAVKSTSSLLKLRINDGKQYTCSSIDITSVPLDSNLLQKSVSFKYDIATGGNEASDYAVSYFKHLNIGAVQSVEGGKNICTITFSGTPEEINSTLKNLFGEKNKIKYSDYKPFMTMRTTKQFTDHIDFSSLIVGKNIDTPVNYFITTQNGDIVKSFKSVTQNQDGSYTEESSYTSSEDKNTVSIKLTSSDSEINFDISSPNISEIITFSVLSAVIVIIALIILFAVRSRTPKTVIQTAQAVPALPAPQKKPNDKK